MPVYKNVIIGNFGIPVVISETASKAQLMQTGKKRSVSQGSPLFLSQITTPQNPQRTGEPFNIPFQKDGGRKNGFPRKKRTSARTTKTRGL
jgi:hypothetical protein